ncbi:aldehyde dehydrogenase family protein [Nocardia inohanensis]|uniref:aldehyde dehydrogenase family protein n=1 Tax=Nocardia inohanensis TaxID=209246 RepID=UPI0008344CEA|nr:aldehyde dehydrogenase family protein [Nocardia inohanensis]
MTIEVRNPADGRVVGSAPAVPAADIPELAERVRAEQREWERIGPEHRAKWLGALRDWILDHEAELAETIHSESGRPRFEAQLEVLMVADLINYWSAHAAGFLADEQVRPSGPVQQIKRLVHVFRPYPLVGVIAPWNFPLLMPTMDTVPALLAGCAVLVKPSEVTPLSALLLARGWREIGAPPVLEIIAGLGDTGAAVVDAVDYVQFTGSTATGRKIARVAAERMIPCSLELGGKDPAIVLADADIDRAAEAIAWGGMVNSGQVCISVERVYVEAPVYDEFVTKLAAKVGSLRQGLDSPSDPQDIGPLATEAQAEIVRAQVEQAVAAGARILTGGKRTGTGTFFEPTVLVDVDHTMACMREETFGPTLPVMKVADAAEAVRMANDSPYGLSASVWCGDTRRGAALARELEVGAVNVNDVLADLPMYPLTQSGWKQSGIGSRMGGASGIRKYCRVQSITLPRVPTPAMPIWYPYTSQRSWLVRKLMRAVVARDLHRALGIHRDKSL